MIGVRAMEPSEEGEKLAETGKVRYMENEPEGILSISNNKPVYKKNVSDEGKSRRKNKSKRKNEIPIALFRDFLYVKDAQEQTGVKKEEHTKADKTPLTGDGYDPFPAAAAAAGAAVLIICIWKKRRRM